MSSIMSTIGWTVASAANWAAAYVAVALPVFAFTWLLGVQLGGW